MLTQHQPMYVAYMYLTCYLLLSFLNSKLWYHIIIVSTLLASFVLEEYCVHTCAFACGDEIGTSMRYAYMYMHVTYMYMYRYYYS